jgi:hypothetical protein
MHELGPEPGFNESMYVNVVDPGSEVGGFLRLGIRANEGIGEMTACLYLPDGRVAFMFRRPAVTTNDTLDAGGLSFEVVEPFEELRADYGGPVLLLEDPWRLLEPAAAFSEGPVTDAEVRLTCRGLSTPFGGEPDRPAERAGEEFARGHYEQLVAVTGAVRVGRSRWEIHGFGLRDHSWGPRSWQAPWYYRWLTGNAGERFGFMGSHIARRHGDGLRTGFVWEDGLLHPCRDVVVRTTAEGRARSHDELELVLSSGERTWRLSGSVLRLVPLRNRRRPPGAGEPLVTRICEGLTRWRLEDGRVGYGISEYLDQMEGDLPVGAGRD